MALRRGAGAVETEARNMKNQMKPQQQLRRPAGDRQRGARLPQQLDQRRGVEGAQDADRQHARRH